jgi:hypothetical protein
METKLNPLPGKGRAFNHQGQSQAHSINSVSPLDSYDAFQGGDDRLEGRNPSTAEGRIRRIAQQARVDLEAEQPEPERFITLSQGDETFTVGTAGNFSLVTGKAKSRKSFFTTMLMAAALETGSPEGILQGNLPPGKGTVLLFDTEQGDYHVQMAARRALTLAGPGASERFEAYSLRGLSTADRLDLIDYILYRTPGVGLVVIDGIRDLVSSINDEDQATLAIGSLMRWSKELGIHIVGVLHQNKNDSNARGHLGTEALNKAETVISVAKESRNSDLSTARAEYSRDLGFNPFSFTVNGEGLPEIVGPREPAERKGGKSEIPPQAFMEILKKTFSKHPKPKYRELLEALKEEATGTGHTLSEAKARSLISVLRDNGSLRLMGKEGTRYCHYELALLP